MRRILLMTFIFCIGIIQSFAQDFDYTDENGVTWKCTASSGYNASDGTWVNDPNVCITGASNYGDEVVVPSTIPYLGQNYPVLTMEKVFSQNKTLKKVTLPKTVKRLYSTFSGCISLTSVENTSQIVGVSNAFNNCSSLTELDLSSCQEIVSNTFSGCNNLKKVILKVCKTIGGYAFYRLENLQSVGDLSNCTSIGDDAFCFCSSLQDVNLSNCTSIGDYAFDYCSSLQKVNLSKCTSIGDNAFDNCRSLQDVNLSNCTSIGKYAFENCSKLTDIDLSSCKYLGDDAFSSCNNLEIVKNINLITTIASGIFKNCSKLTDIDLSSCSSIGKEAFSGCSSLESVDLSSCSVLSDDAFSSCNNLKIVKNINLITAIASGTFKNCSKLANIDLSSCSSIGKEAFSGCSSLESVDLGSCSVLSDKAFSSCNNLEIVKNINLITTIASGTFKNCSKLTDIDLSSCSSIGEGAFSGCSSLSSVKGIENVEVISSEAFSNTALGDLNLPKCTTIGANAFSSCPNIKKVDLPKCESLGDYAFRGCTNLSILNIPVCQSIAMGAFGQCNSLNEVSLPETIKNLGYKCFDGNTVLTLYATDVPALEAQNSSYVGDVNADALPIGKNVLIIVPEASLAKYQSAQVWKDLSERIFPMGTQFDYDEEVTAQSTTSGIQQVIPQDKLRSVVTLKLKGTINSYDIMIMRNKMDNLHYLDLSDVDVVANPYQYYTGYCTQDSVLGPHSFADLSKLIIVKLPNSVKYIKKAFNNCDQLQSVTLPKQLIAIGDNVDYETQYSMEIGAFSSCYKLKEVIMPSANVLGANTFKNCRSLTEISLPRNLKKICSHAFSESGLTSIVLPDSVESIGTYAFYTCGSLSSVQFPPSLKYINSGAFEYCGQLESISLPGLTKIEDETFYGCNKLSEVKVPSTLERIGDNAFARCDNLNKVYTYTVLPINITQNTFTNFKETTLYVPTQSYDNYYWNTQWSQFREIKEFNEPYDFFYLDNVFVLTKRFEGDPNIDIKDNGALKVVGSEAQKANLVTVKSDGTTGGTLIGNGNLNAKELQFDITVNANQWYFLSFPFNIKFTNIKAPGKYVIRKYDGAQRANNGKGGWVDLAADEDSLKQGVGYIFQTATAGEFILKVEKDQFGNMEAKDINTVLNAYSAKNVQNASWNFIGNTQTSYVDVNALGYDAPITYWNGSSYEAVRPGDDELVLHPFQAFFVQKPTDVNGIEFKAEDRMTKEDATNQAKAAKARRVEKGITPDRLLINLSVTDGKNIDNTRVVFNEKKSQAYELDCDAAKFESTSDAPQLYSIEAQAGNLAINERPMGSVNLGFKAKKAGNFTISAKRMDQPMLLKDNVTGATYDLTDGDYQFTSDAGTFNNRFVLVSSKGTTGIADIVSKTGVNIMPTESGINFNGLNGKNVSVYSVNGTLLATRNCDGMLNLMTGVYIIKVDNMSTKVMVK